MKAPDVYTAVKIYYTHTEIGNTEIRELFGGVSKSKITQLKAKAREEMAKDNIITCHPTNVSTKAAYTAWGLDIHDLEKRFKRSKELGLQNGGNV